MRKTSSSITSSKRATQFSASRQHLLFALLTFSSLTSGGAALAANASLPTGGHFVGGSGAITQGGNHLSISQSSQTGIINWQSFSIGKGNSVTIANGKGATLNRVTGSDISTIAGSLKSTGSVYVVNQAGVVVGPSGKVVTNGTFVASTRDVSNTTFMAGGNVDLSGSSSGTVINQGSITSTDGNVVLVGRSVANSGSVSAAKGSASLVAGDNVLLQASGDDAVLVETGSGNVGNRGTVEAAQVALNAAGGNVYALAVNNGGIIRATGTATKDGHVYLTAGDGVTVNSTVAATNADGSGGTIVATGAAVTVRGWSRINASGTTDGGTVLIGGDRHGGTERSVALSKTPIANAQTTTVAAGARINADGGVNGDGGNVVLWSQQNTGFAGAISARGGRRGGNGGFVEVSGKVKEELTGKVTTRATHGTTGTLLLDPQDIVIYSSTDSNQGSFNAPSTTYLQNTVLDTMLGTTDVVLQTSGAGTANGDIHFGSAGGSNGSNAAPVFWGGTNSLTLNAAGIIDEPGGTPTSSTGNANTADATLLIDAMGTGNITLSGGGNGVAAGGTVVTMNSNVLAHGGTITLASTTQNQGYEVVIANQGVVTNSFVSNAAPGNIVLQGDVVRMGVGTSETGKATTTGNVIIEPLTPGPVTVGNNNTGAGNSSTVGNTAFVDPESIENISANTLVIGSSSVTDMSLATVNGGPIEGINANANALELLTGPTGSISQDARTPIAVTTGPLTGVGVVATGGLALVSGGPINVPDFLNFFNAIAVKQLSGGAGGSVVVQGNSTDDNNGTLNIGTVAGISGISAPGSAVTLINVGTTTQDTGASAAITTGSLVLEGGTTGQYANYTYFDGNPYTYPDGNPGVIGHGFNGFTGAFSLNNTSNAISNIAGSVGSLSLANNVSLTITKNLSDNLSTPTTFSGITAYYSPAQTPTSVNQTGSVKITDNGVLTIANGAPIVTTRVSGAPVGTPGGNVQLEDGSPATGTVAANTGFVNLDGTAAFNVTGGGFWRVYSQDPRNDNDGGLTAYSFVQYNAANYYGDPAASGNGTSTSPSPFSNADGVLAGNYTGTGNGFLYTVAPTAKETLTGTFDKTYDGTNTVTSPLTSTIYAGGVTGTINGDTVTFNNPINSPTGTATATYAGTNAGTYAITLSPTVAIVSATDANGAMVFGYGQSITNHLSGTINKASLTLTPKAVSVVFDGSTLDNTAYSDTTGNYTITGFVGGDTLGNSGLTLTGSMAFNDLTTTAVRNVGTYSQKVGTLGLTTTDGNYTLNFSNPTPNNYVITPLGVTIAGFNGTRVYDGLTDADGSILTLTNIADGDHVTISGVGVLGSKNVGKETITGLGTLTLGGADAGNYEIEAGQSDTFVIVTPATLTVSAVTQTKVYNGTTTSSLTPTITGLQTGDSITGTNSQSYNSPNVMGINGSTLTALHDIGVSDGNSGGNYNVVYQTAPGTISKASLTFTPKAVSVVYDGTTLGETAYSDVLGNYVIGGFQGSDTLGSTSLTLTGSMAFGGSPVRNVGDYTQGAGTLSLTSTNYSLSFTNPAPHDYVITPATLTVSAVTQTKVYDGTTTSTLTPTITGLQGGDTLTGTNSQSYNSPNVMGTNGSTLTALHDIGVNDGNSGGNYTIVYHTAMGTITPLGVTVADLQGKRVYDGSTDANGSILSITDLVPGDHVTITGSGVLASKNVGKEQITGLGTLALGGADAGNYTLEAANPDDFVIVTKAMLTVSAVTQTKVYDGTTTSTLTPTIVGLQTGDSITGTKSQSYGSRNVLGTNGSTLGALHDIGVADGNSGGNYTIVYKTAKGTITPEHVTVTATPNTKTFDGTETATATPTVTSGMIFNPDTGTFTETYNTKHAGTGLTLTPKGSISDGNGGKNYVVTYIPISGANPGPGGKAGIITPELLTISAVTQTKVYDGTTTSTGTPLLTSGVLLDGDTLTDLSQAYKSKNVLGTNGSTLVVNPHYVLTDASDYKVTLKTARGTITPLAITATGTRVYNGKPGVNGSILTITDLIPGDDVGLTGTGTSSSPHVGTHKVTGGFTLTGPGAGNYTLTGGHETVKITPFAVILTGTRVYDGETDGDAGILSVTNAFAGDTVTVDTGTSTIVSRNVGNEKIVKFGTLTLGGASAGDYTLVGAKGKVIVTPEMLTVTAVPGTKTYDGTTTSTGKPIVTTGTVFGPDTGTFIQTYGTKHAGTGLTLTPGGLVDDGNHGKNYIITFVPITTGVINPLPVILAGTRIFDNQTDAKSTILNVTNLIPGDMVTVSGDGVLKSPAVGNEPIVGFTGLTLNGPSTGDYTLVGAIGNVQVTPQVATSPADNNQSSQVPDQTASGNGTQVDFSAFSGGIVTLQPRQNGIVTGTIATIDGTDYHPDSQLGCTLGAAGCIQNGVAPTTTSVPPQ